MKSEAHLLNPCLFVKANQGIDIAKIDDIVQSHNHDVRVLYCINFINYVYQHLNIGKNVISSLRKVNQEKHRNPYEKQLKSRLPTVQPSRRYLQWNIKYESAMK